jgi:hypothetical protein
MVSKLQDFRVPGLQGSREENLFWSPCTNASQEFPAGSLAGTFPDALTKLADLVWVLFY